MRGYFRDISGRDGTGDAIRREGRYTTAWRRLAFEKFKVAASSSTGAVLGAVAQSSSVKEALVERCKEHGLDSDFIEQRLTSALGLSEKMRVFCSKLSPKCAIATASVGLSIPALVAFAPLLGGAATATAVASAFGALGTLLPASVASGVTAGALGAVAPMSLALVRRNWSGSCQASSGTARRLKTLCRRNLLRKRFRQSRSLRLRRLPRSCALRRLGESSWNYRDSRKTR